MKKQMFILIMSIFAIFFLSAQTCNFGGVSSGLASECMGDGEIVCEGTSAYQCQIAQFGTGFYVSRASRFDVSMCGAEPSEPSDGSSTTHPASSTSVPACLNERADRDETDVDCGGPECRGCLEDYACAINRDCAPFLKCESKRCVEDTAAVVDCTATDITHCDNFACDLSINECYTYCTDTNAECQSSYACSTSGTECLLDADSNGVADVEEIATECETDSDCYFYGPDYSCQSGSCVEVVASVSCSDTDSGADFTSQGEITGTDTSGVSYTYTDECDSTSGHLTEYYCSGTRASMVSDYDCSFYITRGLTYVCESGACVPNECVDAEDCLNGLICANGECTYCVGPNSLNNHADNDDDCVSGYGEDYTCLDEGTESACVLDEDGLSNIPPVADCTNLPSYGQVGVVISFTSASTDSDGTISSYNWDFGDSQYATSSTATHTYAVAGTYLVTLTVTDNENATNSCTSLISIPSVTDYCTSDSNCGTDQFCFEGTHTCESTSESLCYDSDGGNDNVAGRIYVYYSYNGNQTHFEDHCSTTNSLIEYYCPSGNITGYALKYCDIGQVCKLNVDGEAYCGVSLSTPHLSGTFPSITCPGGLYTKDDETPVYVTETYEPIILEEPQSDDDVTFSWDYGDLSHRSDTNVYATNGGVYTVTATATNQISQSSSCTYEVIVIDTKEDDISKQDALNGLDEYMSLKLKDFNKSYSYGGCNYLYDESGNNLQFTLCGCLGWSFADPTVEQSGEDKYLGFRSYHKYQYAETHDSMSSSLPWVVVKVDVKNEANNVNEADGIIEKASYCEAYLLPESEYMVYRLKDTDSGEYSFKININNVVYTIHGGTVTDEWQTVVGIYDGSKILLYVEGKLVASKSIEGVLFNPPNSVYIGGSYSGGVCDSSFGGDLDDIYVYGG